ncbi:Gfo/Idh/MocA family oxidoreductase [Gordonia sinesedis]
MGLTVGVVGLGRIGAFHADTLDAMPGVDTLLVTDPNPAAVDSAITRLGSAQAVSDTAALLRADIDALVIASATPTHADLIERGVAAGVPTFCEKPIALSLTDSVELARRLGDPPVPVQVGYNRRFDPAMSAARAAVAAGDLGFVTTARSTTLDPAPPPPEYIAASGGIFRDCAVHDFDVLRWVLDDDVIAVHAVGGNQGDPHFAHVGDVDTASILLTFATGTIGVVSVTRYNGRGYDCRLELHGSTDSVAAGWTADTPIRNLESTETFPDDRPFTFFMDRFAAAYRAELDAFRALAETYHAGTSTAGQPISPCTVADAIEVALVAEAATRSAATGRPVRIDEVRPDGVPAPARTTTPTHDGTDTAPGPAGGPARQSPTTIRRTTARTTR